MINVAVVFGGKSVEHDISIISYMQVISSLDQKKYKIIPVYFSKNNDIYCSDDFLDSSFFRNKGFNGRLYRRCFFAKFGNKVYIKKGFKKINIDVAIVAMHGKGLEDGTISGYFKMFDIPVVISGVGESCILHDKFYTKLIMKELGINILDYKVVDKSSLPVNIEGKKIIKACKLGSSIGVKVASGKEEINSAIYECLKFDEKVIVERKLDNFRELNQALYIKKSEVVLSDIEEIIVKNNLFSFENKYQNERCERVVPAEIADKLAQEINDKSLKIGKNLIVNGVIRIDYLYDLDEEKLYLNEVNVIPGSLAYYLFESKGIFFNELLDDLINEATRNKYFENEKIQTFSSNVLRNEKILKK